MWKSGCDKVKVQRGKVIKMDPNSPEFKEKMAKLRKSMDDRYGASGRPALYEEGYRRGY